MLALPYLVEDNDVGGSGVMGFFDGAVRRAAALPEFGRRDYQVDAGTQ